MKFISCVLVLVIFVDMNPLLARAHQQQICQKLCTALLTPDSQIMSQVALPAAQGRPGKRGQQGVKGDRGEIGPSGIVDFDRIDELLETKVREATSSLNSKVDILTENLIQLNKFLDALRQRFSETCGGFRYNGKCFQAVLHDTQDVHYSEGVAMCQSKGWVLANIYSKDHYDLLLEHVRGTFRRNIFAWLGMAYDTQTRRTALSNGITAPYLKWHAGYPNSATSDVLMGIVVKLVPNQASEGVHNAGTKWVRNGALCEY